MSGRHRSHTWDHLLLAKFYNQRVSGQGSINNSSIYQAALRRESIQSSHLVTRPPIHTWVAGGAAPEQLQPSTPLRAERNRKP